MRATYLGSSPLTVVVACPCGRARSFDPRRRPPKFNFRCDNCRSVIGYPSLKVIVWRGLRMRFQDLTTEEREEFGEEIAAVDAALDHLEVAAKGLDAKGYPVRGHKLRNDAADAKAQIYLLMQDRRDRKAGEKRAETAHEAA